MQKFSETFLVFTIVALFVAKFSEGKICCEPAAIPSGYVTTPNVGTHKIYGKKMTWNEARKQCMADGAHLALLDSAEEEALFKSWMTRFGMAGVWLGFHDLFEEGSWTTVTGKPVGYTGYRPWAEGEPNDGMWSQDCGILWETYKGHGADDYNCDNEQSSICEIICTC